MKSFEDHVDQYDELSINQQTLGMRNYGQDVGKVAFEGLMQMVDALKQLGQQDPNALLTIVNKMKAELGQLQGGEEAAATLRQGANRFVRGAGRLEQPSPTRKPQPQTTAGMPSAAG